jgi:phosphoenolpyruvate carboxylase
VVLFDAIEDSSFSKTTKFDESGTLQTLLQQIAGDESQRETIKEKLWCLLRTLHNFTLAVYWVS